LSVYPLLPHIIYTTPTSHDPQPLSPSHDPLPAHLRCGERCGEGVWCGGRKVGGAGRIINYIVINIGVVLVVIQKMFIIINNEVFKN